MGDDREDDLSDAIAESLAGADYGALLRQRGITTAALDEEGQIVVLRPDGTSELLAEEEEQGGPDPSGDDR